MSNKTSLIKNEKAMAILEECIKLGYTDSRTQQRLVEECGHEWALITIRNNRKKLGVLKTPGEEAKTISTRPPLSVPPPGLSESERSQWFINDFKNSHLFTILKRQFSEQEVAIYLEEYGRICCQFEDIVVSEFFQIDKYLKHRILINRQLILTKVLQQEISEITAWISSNPVIENETPEKKKIRVETIMKLESQYSALRQANERYDKLVKEEENMSKSLNATRKDRMEQLSGGRENFLNLVAMLQHSEKERDQQGKYAELTKIASNDILKELRKPVTFPDGEIDTIITDQKSVMEE